MAIYETKYSIGDVVKFRYIDKYTKREFIYVAKIVSITIAENCDLYNLSNNINHFDSIEEKQILEYASKSEKEEYSIK